MSDLQAVVNAERTWHVETRDVLDGLRQLPDGCVHSCVTSPPYFALRSYLDDDHPDKAKEIGSEPTPEAFIETMVAVFREVRRVLHESGTCFVNLGDSYSGGGRGGGSENSKQRTNTGSLVAKMPIFGKPGDLLNMPHRVAEALRADGWYWRSTIVWAKKSPMPESIDGWRWEKCRVRIRGYREVRQHRMNRDVPDRLDGGISDIGTAGGAEYEPCPGCAKCEPNGGLVLRRGKWRCTTAHEYVFQFSKSERYFCDAMGVAEKSTSSPHRPGAGQKNEAAIASDVRRSLARHILDVTETRNPRSVWTSGDRYFRLKGDVTDEQRKLLLDFLGNYFDETNEVGTVMRMSTEPFKQAHFATFPSKLPDKILRAATSEKGCCPTCLVPWAPIVERERIATRPAIDCKHDETGEANRDPQRHIATKRVVGWRACCNCGGEPIPMLVLDPFAGAGTTIMAARRLGLRAIGLELNPEYAAMARERIGGDSPLFNMLEANHER